MALKMKDFLAVCNTSAFSGYGIVDVDYGIDDKVSIAYFYNGHIDEPVVYTIEVDEDGRQYVIINEDIFYLSDFIRL